MALLKRSRFAQNYDVRRELPAAFKAETRFDDQRARHLLTLGTPEATRELCEMYLPLVTALAYAFLRKRKSANDDNIEDLISDGCLELVRIAQDPDLELWDGVLFAGYLKTAIRRSFFKQFRSRAWGGWSQSEEKLARIRLRYHHVRRHGRAPAQAEVDAQLASLITNPNIQIGEKRQMFAAACAPAAELSDALNNLATPRYSTLSNVIDRETIALAMKGLKGIDRKIFKLAIDGVPQFEIARRTGVSKGTIFVRINGLLWEARCRADLASALGVEPASHAKRNDHGHIVSLKRIPPAQMVKSA